MCMSEGPWEEGGDADNVWMKMATCIRKVASKEAKIRIPGGGMMMSRRRLKRRKIASDAYTWIGVQTT